MWFENLIICVVIVFNFFVDTNGKCVYANHFNKTNPPGHERLKYLMNKTYFVNTPDYTFYIGICTKPKIDIPPDQEEAGVLQVPKTGGKGFVIGRRNASEIKAGENWVFLEYAQGNKYGTHCGGEHRRASIMFTCNEYVTKIPLVRVLEENVAKVSDCYYLFEIAHASICGGYVPSQQHLSVGSILVISLCIIVTTYIVIGFFIQRCRGAKGMDQFPNYGAWQEFGNLIADGCDLIFRSRRKVTNHLYPTDGHPQQTLQPDDRHLIDEDDNDDHMLPM